MKAPVVYLLASMPRGTLYIGVTSNLLRRTWQHREGLADGFAKRYGVKTLVWYEQHPSMMSAIAKEKSMKKWGRLRKIELIERSNTQWRDLWFDIAGFAPDSALLADAETREEPVVPSCAGMTLPGSAIHAAVKHGFPPARE